MNVDYRIFALFEYESANCNNPFRLGDVVIKEKDYYSKEAINEIGVVIQIHDDNELRTDMFGNEDISMLRLATDKEILEHRENLFWFNGFDTALKTNIDLLPNSFKSKDDRIEYIDALILFNKKIGNNPYNPLIYNTAKIFKSLHLETGTIDVEHNFSLYNDEKFQAKINKILFG